LIVSRHFFHMSNLSPFPHAIPHIEPEAQQRPLRLLAVGWSLIEASEGRKVDLTTFARYLNLAKTTFFSWFNRGTQLSQIESLLHLLERLPQSSRDQLLTGLLREFPSLESPRLAHAPIDVSRLRSLLREPRGLTLILGDSDAHRTFVLTALAHEATRIGSSLRSVSGIDAHGSDALVPVPGVHYLQNRDQPAQVLAAVRSTWPKIQQSPVLFFNRIWSRLPAKEQAAILALATKRNVIIADEAQVEQLCQKVRRLDVPVGTIVVTPLTSREIRLEFGFLPCEQTPATSTRMRTGTTKPEPN
jgi:hypothetical protein